MPGRLKTELEEVKRYILGEANTVAIHHQPWAEALKQVYKNEAIDGYMQNALGQVFLTVLEHAGVFKDTQLAMPPLPDLLVS